MSVATHLRYQAPDGEQWRAEAGVDLLIAFDIAKAGLTDWHRVMAGLGQAWEIVCRRYGLRDMLKEHDPDKMRAASDEEIAKALGLKKAHVEELLKQAREYWKKHTRRDVSAGTGLKSTLQAAPAAPMDIAEVNRICTQYGFRTSDEPEKRAIAQRCIELTAFLENDMLRSTAISLVNSERLLAGLYETSENFTSADKGKKAHLELVRAIADVQSKIESTQDRLGIWDAPEVMRKREKFSACMSGVVEAIRDYYASGSRELIDGVFTEAEVEILLREYDLRKPQYPPQLGLIVVPAAIEGLWDPDFKPARFPRHAHRRLMKGFYQGITAARQEDGVEVLELDVPPDDDSED